MASALRDQADKLRDEATRWDAGADGEERVAAALADLDRQTTRVLHDRLLDPGKSEANVDHLVVSQAGVHLIDAKNWIGSVSIHEGSLWQHWSTGDGRRSENKNAELDKVRHMAAKVHASIGLPVVPVLCLAGDRAPQLEQPQEVRGVRVLSVAQLVPWLQQQPNTLRQEDVGTRAVELSCAFPPAVNPGLTMAAAVAADAPADIASRRHSRRSAPTRTASWKPTRRRSSRRSVRPLVALAVIGLALIAIPRLAPMFGSVVSRLATHAVTQPTRTPTPAVTISAQQTQALDDWRIRADLYRANVQPSTLRYVSDVNLGMESDDCRRQQRTLAPYRTGLLRAPDAALAAAARDYDTAAQAQLAACVKNDPVALSHAQAAMSLAAARTNARFNVLKGQDPTSYSATRIL